MASGNRPISRSRQEWECTAVNRVFALLKAGCDSKVLCEELALKPSTAANGSDIAVDGPAELLELLLATLKEVGPRTFLERTASLLPSGTTIAPVVQEYRGASRRRVAILAGNFDPITCSHLTCAAEILHSHSAVEVWLVPARGLWRNQNEEHELASPLDRYCMCQIAVNTEFSSTFPVKVMDVDVVSEGSLYVYDLLCLFKERHPDKEFCFVIGSDRLLGNSNVSTWKSVNKNWKEGDPEDQKLISTGQQLLTEFDLLVIRRPGFDLPPCQDDPSGLKAFGSRLSWIEMPQGATLVQANLGSDEIKTRSKFAMKVRDCAGSKSLSSIDGLVARSVLCYIWRHRLYMPSEIKAPSKKRVAIYGGAFDPITNAHLTCAAEIVHSCCADEVWIVPCGPRPDKPGLKTSPLDRYCMCQIGVHVTFFAEFPIRVSDIECFSENAFPTYDLLCSLRAKHPQIDFSFIIGSDWLQPGSNMAAWTSTNWDWKPGDPEDQRVIVTGDKMLSEFSFLVIKRPGYDVPCTEEDPTGLKQFGPKLFWMTMQEGQTYVQGNLSSTEIRKRTAMAARVRDGISAKDWDGIDGLVPGGVRAYIRRRELYNSSFNSTF